MSSRTSFDTAQKVAVFGVFPVRIYFPAFGPEKLQIPIHFAQCERLIYVQFTSCNQRGNYTSMLLFLLSSTFLEKTIGRLNLLYLEKYCFLLF